MAHQIEVINTDPHEIIPWHNVNLNIEMVLDYKRGEYVPPIPIMSAPRDLEYLGKFMNYNGHHRTCAAQIANVNVDCLLLRSWEDIEFLVDNPPLFLGEVYPELIEGLAENFQAHYSFITGEARKYENLRKLSIDSS